MKDKSRRWYFHQGWLAAQRNGLVRMDETDILKTVPRGLFVKFIQEEKKERERKKKKVWRFVRHD